MGPGAVRGELRLVPLTPASYLAGRAALGLLTESDVTDLDGLTDGALVAFLDAVSDGPATYASGDTLRATAGVVYDAWLGLLDTHRRRATERSEAACERMNWWPPETIPGEAIPVPEEMAGTYREHWPAWRELPLWEVLLASSVGAAQAERERILSKIRETN